MGNKRKLRRRVASITPRQRSKTKNVIDRFQRLSFPRRAFLKGVGVLALAGTGIIGYKHWLDNYSCKTWRPGKETWKPVIYAPSGDMDPVDKAIWLVNENICRYSIDELKRMNLQPLDVYYMVTYQLRVKPITDEHVLFYLAALDTEKVPYSKRKKVFFPQALQGHECQFLDILFRAARNVHELDSKEPGKSWLYILRKRGTPTFKFKEQITSLYSILMDEIKDFPPERMALTNSDPSWIMSAYAGANPGSDEWVPYGSLGDVLRYLPYALERNPETDRPRYFDFACMNTHFPDALSRLYWYYEQYAKNNKDAKGIQDIILSYINKIGAVDGWLKHYSDELIPSIKKFQEEPTKANYQGVFNSFVYIVHTLETILEPEGYYRYNFPLAELEPVVKNLSEGIILWYFPEMDSQRELLNSWEHYNDLEYLKKLQSMSPSEKREMEKINQQMERYTSMSDKGTCSVFMNARLLQGCHGLMLWKEYKQQEAGKSAESISSSPL